MTFSLELFWHSIMKNIPKVQMISPRSMGSGKGGSSTVPAPATCKLCQLCYYALIIWPPLAAGTQHNLTFVLWGWFVVFHFHVSPLCRRPLSPFVYFGPSPSVASALRGPCISLSVSFCLQTLSSRYCFICKTLPFKLKLYLKPCCPNGAF